MPVIARGISAIFVFPSASRSRSQHIALLCFSAPSLLVVRNVTNNATKAVAEERRARALALPPNKTQNTAGRKVHSTVGLKAVKKAAQTAG